VIELFFWEGCPSHPEALELLRTVMGELGRDDEIVVREVTSHEDAEALGFPGSPTIRIDGVDIDSVGASRARPALTCRIYRLPDGRISPVPSRDQLEEALR
jgi:hypothetical protein